MDVKKLETNSQQEGEGKFSENFTSCLGALKIIQDGWETEAIPEPANKYSRKISFFAKIFRSEP